MAVHLIVEDNPGGHEQLSETVDVNTPSLVLSKIYARLLEQLDAVLGEHVVSHFELPAADRHNGVAIKPSFFCPEEAE